MFRVWLEWDYGQDSFFFSTKEKAIAWINSLEIEYYNWDSEAKEEEILIYTYEQLEYEGLCSIEEAIMDP